MTFQKGKNPAPLMAPPSPPWERTLCKAFTLCPHGSKSSSLVYPKYACKCCQSHVAKAPAAPTILPKIQCSPELLSQIVMGKFFMSLPLYRQEIVFEQMGVELSRTTLARWVIAAADAVRPLVMLMKELLLAQKVLHADETPLQVLKGTGKKPQSKTYLWGICSPIDEPRPTTLSTTPPGLHKQPSPFSGASKAISMWMGSKATTFFRIAPGSQGSHAKAHARRKFDVADKAGSSTGASLTSQFLGQIQSLFKLEKDCINLTPEERLQHRTEFSVPIVASIRSLLDDNAYKVPPKSKLR